MNITLEKLLGADLIDWDRVLSFIILINPSKKRDHKRGDAYAYTYAANQQHNSYSSILLAVVKKKHVPVNVVRKLILPSTKLKTLRNAFGCACVNKDVGKGVKELLLDEMDPSPSLTETLLLSAIKSNCEDEDAVNVIIERNVHFLSPGFHRNTFYEDDAFQKLCDILIQRQLVHKDLIFNSQALHASAYRGHEQLTNLIVNMFPGTLTQKDNELNLPLHCACESGLITFQSLLTKGLESNQFKNGLVGGLLAKNKNQKSALRLAIGSGADGSRIRDVVECLHGVDSTILHNAGVMKDIDLLHQIARHGVCLSFLEHIIREHPCAIQWKDQFGKTPLGIACENGQFDTATQMYNVSKIYQQGGTFPRKILRDALTAALSVEENPDRIVEFVLKTDIELTKMQDIMLLHHVAGKGSVPYAAKLISCHPACHASKDSTGSLPIHWACREQNCEMIGYLLQISCYKYGGLLTLNKHGVSPLQHLLDSYVDPDADLLLSSRCILACLQANHNLPLIHFAISELVLDVEIIQELVENFAFNTTSTWRCGKTALIYVIDAFAKDVTGAESQKLLDMFLDSSNTYHKCLSIKDHQGRLPLHYALALEFKWKQCIKKLVDADFCSLAEVDGKTGLLPFMLSAVGPKSDLNTIFHLLRSDPAL